MHLISHLESPISFKAKGTKLCPKAYGGRGERLRSYSGNWKRISLKPFFTANLNKNFPPDDSAKSLCSLMNVWGFQRL